MAYIKTPCPNRDIVEVLKIQHSVMLNVQISLSGPIELLTFFRNLRWRQTPSWIFRLCEFGYSDVLTVWYLCWVPNLVQIYVIITEIDALTILTHLMTSRELTSGFDFWSRGHLRMAVLHLHIKFGADIFIWSDQVIDIFPKSKMAADAILGFQVMWIRLFRRVDSVVCAAYQIWFKYTL